MIAATAGMIIHRKLASQIADVCLNIKAGENVWIHTWDHTVALASQVALECRQKGAHPLITLSTESYWLQSITETPKTLLATLPEHYAATLKKTDAFIFMIGPRHPINWRKIPEKNRDFANVWFLESNPYMDAWRKIAREYRVRMLGVEYCIVTPERARSLGIDYGLWQKIMLAGCLADQRQISERAERLARCLQEKSEVDVQTVFGTKLSFRLARRAPNMGDSIVTEEDAANGMVKFLPSGFVEVAPDENSAEGVAVYDVPIPVHGDRKIKGLKLHFQRGEVVDYRAKSNVKVFEDYLKSGEGDVAKFGFFGLGLNPGLKHGLAQDDKVLGVVTVGVGGNADKGGKNRTDGNRHWWASMTKATVKVDDRVVLVGRELMA